MNKIVLALIIVVVAAASSGATIGIMKYIETHPTGGPIIILSDKRCAECDTEQIEFSLKRMLPNDKIVVADYSDPKGKKLYKDEKLSNLPTVLLPKRLDKSDFYKSVAKYAIPGKEYIVLAAGGNFDPTAEICDNEQDDNNNGSVDCADPTCKSNWKCMEKKEKPDVDVFVMSHCPFGTQIEKGMLPVWDLLGDKMNLNIRFCDYAMHGKKEIDEQIRQYCIQQADKNRYRKYLECFLKTGESDAKCLKEAKVDEAALTGCLKKTDEEFNISKDFENKEKWIGRFPSFSIYSEMTKKYGVNGSPTLVINGVKAQAGRSPKALLDAVCQGFNTKPEECSKELPAANPSPGFGFGEAKGGNEAASCGS